MVTHAVSTASLFVPLAEKPRMETQVDAEALSLN